MSLEGLRAWIAEVERKLGKRTRVFLALAVIAIGIAAAAVYLAIDARNSSVSESDVQALQEKLEERIDEVDSGGGTGLTPPVEPEPAPEAQPAPAPQPGGNGTDGGNGAGNGGQGNGGGGTGGGASGTGPGGAAGNAQLQELLQKAKERSQENE
jgi:uncharacterized membrane protein